MANEEKLKNNVMNDVKLEVVSATTNTMATKKDTSPSKQSVEMCENSETCINLLTVLKAFNSAISEEQAWAVLYQLTKLYRERIKPSNDPQKQQHQQQVNGRFKDIFVPTELENFNLHKDGSVHVNFDKTGKFFKIFLNIFPL